MKAKKKGGLVRAFWKKREKAEEDYEDLDIGEYEDELKEEVAKMYVKAMELTGLHDMPELKKEIYGGNIVIVDISLVKQDKVPLEKMIKDLKMVSADIGGDIAGIGDNQVVVTPAGIKIERKKIVK